MTEQAAKLIEWQKELNWIKQNFLVMPLKWYSSWWSHTHSQVLHRDVYKVRYVLAIFVLHHTFFVQLFFCVYVFFHVIIVYVHDIIFLLVSWCFTLSPALFCDFFLRSSMLHFICICSWRRFYRVERPALQMRMPRVRVKYKVKNVFVSRVIFFSTNDRRRLT